MAKLPQKDNQASVEAFIDLIDEAFTGHRQWRPASRWFKLSPMGSRVENKAQGDFKAVESNSRLYRCENSYEGRKTKSDQWWYFQGPPEVPTDHNLAERTLRLAITKRKVSGGSRSMERFKHTAHLLTVVLSLSSSGSFSYRFL